MLNHAVGRESQALLYFWSANKQSAKK